MSMSTSGRPDLDATSAPPFPGQPAKMTNARASPSRQCAPGHCCSERAAGMPPADPTAWGIWAVRYPRPALIVLPSGGGGISDSCSAVQLTAHAGQMGVRPNGVNVGPGVLREE